ncbi:ABC transporter family protein [Giardia muris]|uniref:ABC transporter family protein n=1 Tax=Giardia muris TaxID=5742 RepID=A0A4Z1SYY4_GIAMU|nr:ABC transporter family protein [Giardia muris]|eukprot:TNJ30680.1 ABC transporter family protein [Giardia muris]
MPALDSRARQGYDTKLRTLIFLNLGGSIKESLGLWVIRLGCALFAAYIVYGAVLDMNRSIIRETSGRSILEFPNCYHINPESRNHWVGEVDHECTSECALVGYYVRSHTPELPRVQAFADGVLHTLGVDLSLSSVQRFGSEKDVQNQGKTCGLPIFIVDFYADPNEYVDVFHDLRITVHYNQTYIDLHGLGIYLALERDKEANAINIASNDVLTAFQVKLTHAMLKSTLSINFMPVFQAFFQDDIDPINIAHTQFFIMCAFCLLILLQVCCTTVSLVLDKMHGHIEALRLLGRRGWEYLLAQFVAQLIIYVITCVPLLVSGYVLPANMHQASVSFQDGRSYSLKSISFPALIILLLCGGLGATAFGLFFGCILFSFRAAFLSIFTASTFLFLGITLFTAAGEHLFSSSDVFVCIFIQVLAFLIPPLAFALLTDQIVIRAFPTRAMMHSSLPWSVGSFIHPSAIQDGSHMYSDAHPISLLLALCIHMLVYFVLGWLCLESSRRHGGLGFRNVNLLPKRKAALEEQALHDSGLHTPLSFSLAETSILSRKIFPIDQETHSEEIETLTENYSLHRYPIVVQLVHLDKKRPKQTLTFRVPKGKVFVILGGNGTGKTALLSTLLGLCKLHGLKTNEFLASANAWVEGYTVRTSIPSIRRIIGFVPQHEKHLWHHLTVLQNLDLYGGLRSIPQAVRGLIYNLLIDSLVLKEYLNTRVSALPRGVRRRVSIAVAWIGYPPYILLDEPTKDLDPISKHIIWSALRALCTRTRARGSSPSLTMPFQELRAETQWLTPDAPTILLTTRDPREAELLGDTVGILAWGQLLTVGSPLALRKRLGQKFIFTLFCQTQLSAITVQQQIERFLQNKGLLGSLNKGDDEVYSSPNEEERYHTQSLISSSDPPQSLHPKVSFISEPQNEEVELLEKVCGTTLRYSVESKDDTVITQIMRFLEYLQYVCKYLSDYTIESESLEDIFVQLTGLQEETDNMPTLSFQPGKNGRAVSIVLWKCLIHLWAMRSLILWYFALPLLTFLVFSLVVRWFLPIRSSAIHQQEHILAVQNSQLCDLCQHDTAASLVSFLCQEEDVWGTFDSCTLQKKYTGMPYARPEIRFGGSYGEGYSATSPIQHYGVPVQISLYDSGDMNTVTSLRKREVVPFDIQQASLGLFPTSRLISEEESYGSGISNETFKLIKELLYRRFANQTTSASESIRLVEALTPEILLRPITEMTTSISLDFYFSDFVYQYGSLTTMYQLMTQFKREEKDVIRERPLVTDLDRALLLTRLYTSIPIAIIDIRSDLLRNNTFSPIIFTPYPEGQICQPGSGLGIQVIYKGALMDRLKNYAKRLVGGQLKGPYLTFPPCPISHTFDPPGFIEAPLMTYTNALLTRLVEALIRTKYNVSLKETLTNDEMAIHLQMAFRPIAEATWLSPIAIRSGKAQALNPVHFFAFVTFSLMPLHGLLVIRDKSSALRVAMHSHGLSRRIYWPVIFGVAISIGLIYNIIIVSLGALLAKLDRTSIGFLISLCLVLSLSQASMGIFLASIVRTHHTFVALGCSFALLGAILSSFLCTWEHQSTLWLFYLNPLLACIGAIYIVELQRYALEKMTGVIISLLLTASIEAFGLLLLVLYLDSIVPNEKVGYAYSPGFICSFLRRRLIDAWRAPRKKQRVDQLCTPRMNRFPKAFVNKLREKKGTKRDLSVCALVYDDSVCEERHKAEAYTLKDTVDGTLLFANTMKTYRKGRSVAVLDVSLGIQNGQTFAFMGTAEAGKSSLLLVASGVIRSTKGDVFFDGRPVHKLKPKHRHTLTLQTGLIDPYLTVRQHLLLVLRLRGVTKETEDGIVWALATKLRLLQYLDTRCGRVSDDVRQLTSLAMALL